MESAYKYTEDHKKEINWNEVVNRMEIKKKDIDKNLDFGTLTPRSYMYSDILSGLENYREELKSPTMQ